MPVSFSPFMSARGLCVLPTENFASIGLRIVVFLSSYLAADSEVGRHFYIKKTQVFR